MKKVFFLFFGWLTLPHVVFYLFAPNKAVIDKDIARWVQCSKQSNPLWGGVNLISLISCGYCCF